MSLVCLVKSTFPWEVLLLTHLYCENPASILIIMHNSLPKATDFWLLRKPYTPSGSNKLSFHKAFPIMWCESCLQHRLTQTTLACRVTIPVFKPAVCSRDHCHLTLMLHKGSNPDCKQSDTGSKTRHSWAIAHSIT